MNILVITITLNRLHLTIPCLDILEHKAGYPYKHIIVDNGSTDGTQEWLQEWQKRGKNRIVLLNKENKGRLAAYLQALKVGLQEPVDFQIEVANDIYIETDNILKSLVDFYEKAGDNYLAAPRLKNPPTYPLGTPRVLGSQEKIGNWTFTPTSHTGLQLEIQPYRVIKEFLTNPPVKDSSGRSASFIKRGFKVGYIEELIVYHLGPTNLKNCSIVTEYKW